MYVIRNINIFWLQCVRVHVYMEGGALIFLVHCEPCNRNFGLSISLHVYNIVYFGSQTW